MKLNDIVAKASSKLMQTKAGAVIVRNAPTIGVGVGVAAVVGGTVWACAKTLVVFDDVLKFDKMVKEDIRCRLADPKDDFDEEDARKARARETVQNVGRVVRAYTGPTIVLGCGIGLILVSHKVMSGRVAAMTAAAETAQLSYSRLKGRVREKLGDKAWRELNEPVVREDTGPKVREDGTRVVAPEFIDAYGGTFEPGNPNYSGSMDVDRLFLKCQERYANDILQARGHFFLNELYDMLGMPHTSAGAVCGWLKDGSGDGYIDLGEWAGEYVEAVVNGERIYHIVPNVDGVIYDKI